MSVFATTVMAMPAGGLLVALLGICAVVALVMGAGLAIERLPIIGRRLLMAVAVAGLFAWAVPSIYTVILAECGMFGCWFDSIFW